MRIRLAATIAVLALLAGLVVGLGVASPAAAAGKPCWEKVIDDWLDNGSIDKRYKASCYREALKRVPEDLRDYSNITDAISAALGDVLRPGVGGGGPAGTDGPNGGSGESGSGGEGNDRRLQATPSRSIYRKAIDNLGTTSADSLPIPLLVLAGLGTALLLTAGGLAARKRLRARRLPPPTP